MIRGTLEKQETNSYGYTTIWVSKTRYGSDKKGAVSASIGDQVSFEAFDKPGKDGRTWPTFQYSTFKKEAGNTDSGPSASPAGGYSPAAGRSNTLPAGRDTYWSDKEAKDAVREPRITYQASYERAVRFVDMAIRNGAFEALAKAKPTARLEILHAFVDEVTERIMKAVYAAGVPTSYGKPQGDKVVDAAPVADAEVESEEQWS